MTDYDLIEVQYGPEYARGWRDGQKAVLDPLHQILLEWKTGSANASYTTGWDAALQLTNVLAQITAKLIVAYQWYST